jgi:hypothetical protein
VAGEPLDGPLLGMPYVVTPGAVVVEASAPGYHAFRSELSVGRGETSTVRITLVRDPEASASEAAPASTPDESRMSAESDASQSSAVSPGAVAVIGVGVAALAVGAVFGALYTDAVGRAIGYCPGLSSDGTHSCVDSLEARAAWADAETHSIGANVGISVGALALTGGAIWLIAGIATSPRSSSRQAVGFAPTLSPGIVGGVIRGEF